MPLTIAEDAPEALAKKNEASALARRSTDSHAAPQVVIASGCSVVAPSHADFGPAAERPVDTGKQAREERQIGKVSVRTILDHLSFKGDGPMEKNQAQLIIFPSRLTRHDTNVTRRVGSAAKRLVGEMTRPVHHRNRLEEAASSTQ
jgi:hypothetical protein